MAELTKKSSKDELFEAMQKWKKKAQDAEAQHRALQQATEEVEMRVESLSLQVSLYKEKEKESQTECQKERQEREMAQVMAESLRSEMASMTMRLDEAEASLATLRKDNATMSQALTQAHTHDDMERIDSSTDAHQLASSLREARLQANEYKARIEDLQKSHEAFVEQSRLEMEADAERKVSSAENAFKAAKKTWDDDRSAMVKTHMQAMDELQTAYNELRAGVETSQAWVLKEKEVVRLQEELAALLADYNTACEKNAEVKKYQAEIRRRDDVIAQLRDQVMVLETDMADTRDLCIRALRQTAAAAADTHPPVVQHHQDTVSVASSSSSLTPPTTPKEKPDLFDLLSTKSRSKTMQKEAKKELTKYKTKVKAQEQARQRNVDEVESYRADQILALLTENDALRRAADRTAEHAEASEELVRVRGAFQRERETWEEERLELQAQVAAAQQPPTAVRAAAAERLQLEERLTAAEARCTQLETELAAQTAAREEAECHAARALEQIEGLQRRLGDLSDKETVFVDRMKEMEALTAVSLELKAKLHEADTTAAALRQELAQLKRAGTPVAAAAPPAAPAVPDPAAAAAAPTAPPAASTAPPSAAAATREQLEQERRNKLAAMREKFRKVRAD